MKNLTLRVLLTLVGMAALGAAGFETWRIEQSKRATSEAARQTDERLRTLTLIVADLRTNQQAYVAAGQGSAFWGEKVSQLLTRFDGEAAPTRRQLRAPDAQAALDEASRAIDNFRKLDVRAREFARAEQQLLASDLIFSDGFEAAASALSALDGARTVEAMNADGQVRAATRSQAQMLAGGAGLCALILLMLAPVPRREAEAETDSSLRELAAPALPVPEDATMMTPAVKAAPMPDLTAAADVCAGLARVLESAELTALLGRAAQIIDAAGLIVWVADRSGAELRPALAHGYSHQTLARMGIIARDAHNAVAAAYRTNNVRTVTGDASANGAVVAPIAAPGGCVGVLAAEVRRGGEKNDAIKALVTVFASQLGTLVSSVPTDTTVAQAQ
jgi:hypothetical protein